MALQANIFVILMGVMGIDTTMGDVVETPCYHEQILDQKQSGVTYLLIMQALYPSLPALSNRPASRPPPRSASPSPIFVRRFGVINPIMDVLSAYMVGRFPLHLDGKREDIQQKQMQTFKLPSTSTTSVRRFSSRQGSAGITAIGASGGKNAIAPIE